MIETELTIVKVDDTRRCLGGGVRLVLLVLLSVLEHRELVQLGVLLITPRVGAVELELSAARSTAASELMRKT